MKISNFAEKFNTTKTTIRYYTSIHLLIPNLEGTYPEYDQKCEKDMADILFFQSKGLTNNEILNIKSIERFSVNDPDTFVSGIHKIIDNKVVDFGNQIKALEKNIQDLQTYKSSISSSHHQRSLGFPFKGLDYLKCSCHGSFSVSEATIINKGITQGKLTCQCGQSYIIDQGILMNTHDQLKNYISSDIHSDFKYVDNEHIAVFNAASVHLKAYLSNIDHKEGVLFVSPGPSLFLMDPKSYFKDDGLYIFILYDHITAFVIKSIYESSDYPGTFMFIMMSENIPITNDTTAIIDFHSFSIDHINKQAHGAYIKQFLTSKSKTFFGLYLVKQTFSHPSLSIRSIDEFFMSHNYTIEKAELIAPISHDEDTYRQYGQCDHLEYHYRVYCK